MRSRRTIPVLCTALATALLGASAQLSGANCSELKIFGSRVTKMIVAELGPQFERASGYTPVVVADVAAVMKRRIESDEPFDLAVLVDFQTDELIKSGRLVAETRTDVMKTGIGVAVKRGAPRPDIGTVDAFTRTLLDAKSITYLKEGASTIYLDRLFARLGIAEALRAKTVKPDTEIGVRAGGARRGRARHHRHSQHTFGARRRTGGTAAAGDTVLHRVHRRRFCQIAEPAGGPRPDQVHHLAGRHAHAQSQRDGAGLMRARPAAPSRLGRATWLSETRDVAGASVNS